MMGTQATIRAVLFDVGGTLRQTTRQDEAVRDRCIAELLAALGSMDGDQAAFYRKLEGRADAYHQWAESTQVELSEAELWTQWMLPDWPQDRVHSQAVRLNQLWRQANGRRDPFPESKEVIEALFRRGYRLGLVSNTTSSTEAPDLLKTLQVAGLFEVVILSCEVGKRKANPDILLEAVRRMEIEPALCAYVGNRPHRDVAAAVKAGFSQTIILRDTDNPAGSKARHPAHAPGHYIDNLNDLLAIFPPLGSDGKLTSKPAWKVSLSTMWAMGNFSTLADFRTAARRMGFGSIELNHKVNSDMLAGSDFTGGVISSIHEPCPADVSTEEQKERGWLISALDEESRQQGVALTRRSIDLAASLGVKAIVVHCGAVISNWPDETKLYDLYTSGAGGTAAYNDLKERLVQERDALAVPHLEAVKKSLGELIAYCRPLGIRLGLENRYHFLDIPLPDEMDQLLMLGSAAEIGFWYDSGHARVLSNLGFVPETRWLADFSHRLVGVHLHDVVGISDHRAPGSGELDWPRITKVIPAGAIITLEIRPETTPEQVRRGLQFLASNQVLEVQS